MLELMFTILMLVISLAVLVKGADFLVDGSADLARFLKVSPFLIGLTIVAFGTSLPELAVSFFSVLGDKADLSLGNIIGSNIANIALIIGLSALITPLAVRSKTLINEFPFLMVSGFLLLVLGSDHFIFNRGTFSLSRMDGLIFIALFCIFLAYVFRSMKANEVGTKVKKEFKEEFQHKNPLLKNIFFILGGIAALIGSGRIFVLFAGKLAETAGISEAFIGLVIAAVGTSLPELATSLTAVWRKHSDIALANIVGSNIFNILFILGVVSLVKPFPVNPNLLAVDGMVMIFITLLFLLFATTGKRISRLEGAVLVALYLAYLGFLVWGL